MKERPILFKTEMVRAILNTKPGVWPAEPIDPGKPFKWQTRRVIKPQPVEWRPADVEGLLEWSKGGSIIHCPIEGLKFYSPYGQPGNSLWVKETFFLHRNFDAIPAGQLGNQIPIVTYATDTRREVDGRTRLGRFMPRWASHLNLEVKAIRVERVQQISDGDVIAEGAAIEWAGPGPEPYKRDLPAVYSYLWDSINGKTYPWHSNPFVWVVEFMRLK